MPGPRLTASEITLIRQRLSAGLGDAAIAHELGRSKQSVARVRQGQLRRGVTTNGMKLNVRVTADEHAAFSAVVEAAGLSRSMALRQLIRQAGQLVDLQAGELAALAEARRELTAVGTNLNQLARLGASGRLSWNAGDAALVRRVALRVDRLAETLVQVLNGARRKVALEAEGAIEALQS